MKQFEYKSATEVGLGYSTHDVAEITLNRYGQDGWEVFQVFVAGADARVWMRREIISE